MKRKPWFVRLLLLAAVTVAAVVGLAVGVLLFAAHTPWGRESVRLIALWQLRPLIAGEIELGEITRLDSSGLGLRRLRARDPQGSTVLELAELELDASALGLLSGELVIERIELRGVRIGLAQLTTERGLLAAFAPRSPRPPEPEPPAPQPPHIVLSQIVLDDVAVEAELPDLGRVSVQRLSARASFRQSETLELDLDSLASELWRDGLLLVQLESAQGRYVSTGAPSRLALVLQAAGSRWQLEGSGRLPGDAEFETAPLALSLQAQGIDAGLLAALGRPAWGEGWTQPLALQLALSGSAATPSAELTATAPAGTLRLTASLDAARHAQLSLSTPGLALAQAYQGLPAGALQGTLTAEAQLNDAPLAAQLEHASGVPVQLRFRQGRLDSAVLPELMLSARLLADRVRELELRLQGDEGTLELRGEAQLSGQGQGSLRLALPHLERLPRLPSLGLPAFAGGALELRSHLELQQARLSAQGTLSVLRLALPQTTLDSLQAAFQVSGDLALPRLALNVKAGGLQAGSARVQTAELRLDARRTSDAVVLGVHAAGEAWGKPFELELERARIGLDGSIEVPALRARALGQQLTLSGRQGARGDAGLVLSAPDLELEPLAQALRLEPPLAGKLALHASARGTLAEPRVQLSLQGRELRVGAGPALTLAANAELDVSRGIARLETHAEAGSRSQLTAHASAEFARGARLSWPERLAGAQLQADLALERIDTSLLAPYLAAPLPVSAQGDLRVRARGSVRELDVSSELTARVSEPGSQQAADVRLEARYGRGELHGELGLSDGDGQWLTAKAQLAHPQASTDAFLTDAARLLQRATWQTTIEVARRQLGRLPFSGAAGKDHSDVEVTARLSATHAVDQEPEAQLELSLRQPERASTSATCTGLESELELRAQLRAGQLEAQLGLSRKAEQLARLQAKSGLELAPLLAGARSPQISGLSVATQLEDIELSSLPYLCNLVHGRLSGSASGRDLLTATPQLETQLLAQRLSLDGRHFIDARLETQVQLPLAQVSLLLDHDGTRSTLQARVPLERRGPSVDVPLGAPLSAQLSLDRLPLAALVPPSAPISQVSGRLSGKLTLSGTRAVPKLAGHLSPDAVGFTATALAQPLSDIGGRIVLQGDDVRIEALTARDGDGELQLDGRLVLVPAARKANAELTLRAKEFPLRQQGRTAGELDATLRVSLGLDERAARIAINAEDVSLWLLGGGLRQGIDLEPHPDVIDPRARPRPKEAVAPTETAALPIELSLTARDSIWVRREDFAAKLSADLSADSKQGQLRVRGPVILRRGYLQLLGKVFELRDRSRIEFVGSAPPDPVLDLRADADTRGQGPRVSVEITGRAHAPVLKFLLDDLPVNAGEAAQALFAPGADSGAATTQVQSFVGGLSGGLFALSARRELGEMMPILLVEPATGGSGSRVRAGFELDSLVPGFLKRFIRGVYVEGIIASGDDQQQQQDTAGGVLLELYLPHDLVTSGQYGPGETWSLDLGWEP
ncbi:MAG: hypothetical protein RL685_292 [Pseudomonadota bacterium]